MNESVKIEKMENGYTMELVTKREVDDAGNQRWIIEKFVYEMNTNSPKDVERRKVMCRMLNDLIEVMKINNTTVATDSSPQLIISLGDK